MQVSQLELLYGGLQIWLSLAKSFNCISLLVVVVESKMVYDLKFVQFIAFYYQLTKSAASPTRNGNLLEIWSNNGRDFWR